MMLSICVEF